MEFGHHPDPAVDFCLEVEAIENDITDRNAGLSPQIPDLGARIERAMQFKVGGDAGAVVAKTSLRTIEAAFKAGRAAGVAVLNGRRQYYYRTDECTATDSTDPACVCWHDEGTGPRADADPGLLEWRTSGVKGCDK